QDAPEQSLQETLEAAQEGMEEFPPSAWITPAGDGYGLPRIGYSDMETGVWTEAFVDARTDSVEPQNERLALIMYYVHILWYSPAPWLYYVVASGLAVAMVLALVTGLLIHLRNFVREFHQFRPEKKARTFWTDMHKVLGVFGFPFQMLFAFTGAYLILAPLLLQVFVGPVFDGDEERVDRAFEGLSHVHEQKPGEKAEPVDIDRLAERVYDKYPTFELEHARVHNYGYDNGVVDFTGELSGETVGSVKLRYRATDGELIERQVPDDEGASAKLTRWMLGLHMGQFGGVLLKVLFFLLALGTCATIVTGTRVWLARRRNKRDTLGHRMLARLTAGVGAGSFVAVGSTFLISRLLPFDVQSRMTLEGVTFVGVLAACIVWASFARDELATWWRQLGLAGLVFLSVPFAALRFSSAGLFGTGDKIAPVVGTDIGLTAMGLILCACAFALWRRSRTNEPTSEEGADA
ncbi:MAG: PepSY-associated TM helix domain-containing protein, partial [Persicimonas sp.]